MICELNDETARKRGVTICLGRDALMHRSLVLTFNVPTFDADDRLSDSRHILYLVHGASDISGVYIKKGYEIAEMYALYTLKSASPELIGHLKEADEMRRVLSVNQIS